MKYLHMGPANCALDLGDGSERAEYVNQDYILHKLGRPHRGVNLMYTYYPTTRSGPPVSPSTTRTRISPARGITPTMITSPMARTASPSSR